MTRPARVAHMRILLSYSRTPHTIIHLPELDRGMVIVRRRPRAKIVRSSGTTNPFLSGPRAFACDFRRQLHFPRRHRQVLAIVKARSQYGGVRRSHLEFI